MFQKDCTEKVKSFCFEAEEFENETTGEKEWTKVNIMYNNISINMIK